MTVNVFVVSLAYLQICWLRLSIFWAQLTIANFDVVLMSVGHLNPSPAIFLGMYSSSVGNEVILFESLRKSFWVSVSNIFLMSSSDDVRCGP